MPAFTGVGGVAITEGESLAFKPRATDLWAASIT
jgi:hypothetical protein